MVRATVPTIGILALQGGYSEHVASFRRIGVAGRQVRSPKDLDGLHGLVLPGGESTAIGLLAESSGLIGPLRSWREAGRPVWGTCAGMIMLADQVLGQKEGGQSLIGGLDITVSRNHFGGQLNSFEAAIYSPLLNAASARGVFIRAPAIIEVGERAEPVATLADGTCVGVRQGFLLATAFHPELTADDRWHRIFLDMVLRSTSSGRQS